MTRNHGSDCTVLRHAVQDATRTQVDARFANERADAAGATRPHSELQIAAYRLAVEVAVAAARRAGCDDRGQLPRGS